MPTCQLTLHDLRLPVRLGWTAAEKSQPQEVGIDLTVHFTSLPKAMYSDDLADTFCYDKAAVLVRDLLKERTFNLIEHLAAGIHEVLNHNLLQGKIDQARLTVTVTKCVPPMAGFCGRASFTYQATSK